MGQPQGLDASGLASEILKEERPDLFGSSNRARMSKDRIELSSRKNYTFKFDYATGVSASNTMYDVNAVKRNILFSELPADFRNAYEASLKQLRESYKNSVRGGQRTGVIPPLH